VKKKEQCHTVETVPKSNQIITESRLTDTPSAHALLLTFLTDTSIKGDALN